MTKYVSRCFSTGSYVTKIAIWQKRSDGSERVIAMQLSSDELIGFSSKEGNPRSKATLKIFLPVPFLFRAKNIKRPGRIFSSARFLAEATLPSAFSFFHSSRNERILLARRDSFVDAIYVFIARNFGQLPPANPPREGASSFCRQPTTGCARFIRF